MIQNQMFTELFGIQDRDIVCIVGAGGKTSLLFRLAAEAKARGARVLVTTTTKLARPERHQYDYEDLTGLLFEGMSTREPGVYLGAYDDQTEGKVVAPEEEVLADRYELFDLVLIEADGAARKRLKGWKPFEPVIPSYTTKTIGVLDVQAVGTAADGETVHRLEQFCTISGVEAGGAVTLDHLARMVEHENGLFQYAKGERILFCNKVESDADGFAVRRLRTMLKSVVVTAGSILQGTVRV